MKLYAPILKYLSDESLESAQDEAEWTTVEMDSFCESTEIVGL